MYLYIVLSVLLWCTASDYHVSIFTLYCLFFFDVWLLITTLVSLHCIVCSSLMYGFWLPQSEAVHQRRTDNTMQKYQRGNQKPYIKEEQTIQCKDTNVVIRSRTSKKNRQYNVKILTCIFTLYCLFFFDVQLLITTLVSLHCIVCSSLMNGFWLPLYIKEEQTIQCKDTNVVIRSRTSKENRQYKVKILTW
jgi:ABC-type bacteriocin/lantibiotic exporter with double-glycine peptidase domain